MKKIIALFFVMAGICGCARPEEIPAETAAPEEEVVEETVEVKHPQVLYQGHASLRIITPEDKVIYVDPYMGDGYEEKADLILMTHDHYDHVKTDLITQRSDDCETITWKEALVNGEYNTFDTKDVKIEAVQAGNNANHDINVCVGYVLTFSDGTKLYITGDTSATEQMSELKDIDYMFICCDGIYNMGPEEAAECASTIGASHSIPYHTKPDNLYDETIAQAFVCDGAMYVKPGEEITLE